MNTTTEEEIKIHNCYFLNEESKKTIIIEFLNKYDIISPEKVYSELTDTFKIYLDKDFERRLI
jgi:hypothetical protein